MKAIEFGFTADEVIRDGKITQKEINQLKSWLTTQNLPQLTDEQITLFLISCVKNQEQTKNTLKACYRLTLDAPLIANDRDIDNKELLRQAYIANIFIGPKRTEDGSAFFFGKLADSNYRNVDVELDLKLMSMAMLVALYDYPPTGIIAVFDMKGVGWMHLTKLNIRLIRLFFKFLQEGCPVRLKEVHILNSVYFIDKCIEVVRPFVSNSVLNVTNFHSPELDIDTFTKKYVPKIYMPGDYGGDLEDWDVLHEMHIEKLRKLKPHFEAEERQRRAVNLQF